jgi:hypothetical protein
MRTTKLAILSEERYGEISALSDTPAMSGTRKSTDRGIKPMPDKIPNLNAERQWLHLELSRPELKSEHRFFLHSQLKKVSAQLEAIRRKREQEQEWAA